MSKFLSFLDRETHIVNVDEVVYAHTDYTFSNNTPKFYIEIKFKNSDVTHSLEYIDKELFKFDFKSLIEACEGVK